MGDDFTPPVDADDSAAAWSDLGEAAGDGAQVWSSRAEPTIDRPQRQTLEKEQQILCVARLDVT